MADTWPPRILTLAAWALAAWSATYWALQYLGSRPPATAPAFAAVRMASVEPTNVARLFGPAIEVKAPEPVAPVVVDPSTRFSLVGVVSGQAKSGVALLSVEGKPARPYRVGATIDDIYTLKSVTARSALLATSETGETFTVNLAAPGSSPLASVSVGRTGPAAAPGSPSTFNPAAPSSTPAPQVQVPRFGPLPSASAIRRSS